MRLKVKGSWGEFISHRGLGWVQFASTTETCLISMLIVKMLWWDEEGRMKVAALQFVSSACECQITEWQYLLLNMEDEDDMPQEQDASELTPLDYVKSIVWVCLHFSLCWVIFSNFVESLDCCSSGLSLPPSCRQPGKRLCRSKFNYFFFFWRIFSQITCVVWELVDRSCVVDSVAW